MIFLRIMAMKNDNFYRNICWMLISICIIVSSGIHKTPTLEGDAREYLLMSQAFIAHGSASLRDSDVEDIVTSPGNKGISEGFPADILSWSPPFYSAKSGGLYSYHFWLFSLIFSPFVLFARLIGFADTSGYLFGNIFLVCLTIFSLFRSKTYGLTLSVFGSILFLSIGGIYYIRWAHPEIFSASLMCIGLVFLRDGRNKFSAFLMALAAQQNPPIILILPLIFILDITRIYRNGCGFYGVLKRTYIWIPIVLISVLSMLFYRIEFGVFNLISSVGAADVKLISTHRFLSLFFDPNFGIFWAIPFVFIAGAGVLIFKATINTEWKWVFIFTLMAVICAIPSLSTSNWNSGMSVILRYGFWCAVPLLFVFMEIFKCIEKRKFKIFVISIIIFLQIGLVFFNKWAFSGSHNYIEFHPAAKFFLRKFPRLYSPVPEVFIERGSHREVVENEKIYFFVNSGQVNKVLFNRTSVEEVSFFHVCDNESIWKSIYSIDNSENQWVYWNLRGGCFSSLPDGFHVAASPPVVHSGQVLFPSDNNLFRYGWQYNEVSHRWSMGGVSILNFKASDPVRYVTIYGFFYGEQKFEILLNGEFYSVEKKSSYDWDVDSSFLVDLSVVPVPDDGVYALTFRWLDATQNSKKEDKIPSFALRRINFGIN